MEASKEEQRGVVRFLVAEGAGTREIHHRMSAVHGEHCMHWQVCTSGRDSAKDAHRARDRPIEPLRLMWLRELMIWSGKTDESEMNKFVFTSDEEVQESVRLWIHQWSTSFYKTGIDRPLSQWDKRINTPGNYFRIKQNSSLLCSGYSVFIWLPLIQMMGLKPKWCKSCF